MYVEVIQAPGSLTFTVVLFIKLVGVITVVRWPDVKLDLRLEVRF
jgi:hypothetical protein